MKHSWKFGTVALHVAEVDVEDPPLRPEELDHLAHIRCAPGISEQQPRHRSSPQDGLFGFSSYARLKPAGSRNSRADAAQHRHRRIVRMQRHPHARLLPPPAARP